MSDRLSAVVEDVQRRATLALRHGGAVDSALAAARWQALRAAAESGDTAPEALGDLYETLLGYTWTNGLLTPTRLVRQHRGAYFTSPAAAGAVVRAALEPFLGSASAAPPRVLDPAVGAGAFLLAAGRLLAAAGYRSPRLAHEALYGVDVDRVAVEVARLAVSCWAGAPAGRLRWGDSLTGDRWLEDQSRYGRTAEARHAAAAVSYLESAPAPSCHWPSAYPEVAAAGGFDAVVGNPPYLSVKRGQLAAQAARLRRRYRLARGQWDAYMLFVEQAFVLLRHGGRLGFVLPRPALVNEHGTALRSLILDQGALLEVIDLGQAFPGAGVECVGVIAEKGAAQTDVVLSQLSGTGTQVRTRVAAEWLANSPGHRLPVDLEPAAAALLATLHRAPLRLADVADVRRGLEIGKGHAALRLAPEEGAVPLLRGEDVGPYQVRAVTWLQPEELGLLERKTGLAWDTRPKLLIRRVAGRPIAAFDTHGCWLLNTLYLVQPKDPADDLAWVLAILNSQLAADWFRATFGADERLFPYLRQRQLLDLPLPAPDAELSALARLRSRAAEPGLEDRLEQRVREVYGLA